MDPKQPVVDSLKDDATFTRNTTVYWDVIQSFDRTLYAGENETRLTEFGESLTQWQQTFIALTSQDTAIQAALNKWGAMLGITFARADGTHSASIRFGAADLKNNGYTLDLRPTPDAPPKFDIFIDSARGETGDEDAARFTNPVEGSRYFATLVHEV